MRISELRRELKIWVEKLSLQQWRIEVRIGKIVVGEADVFRGEMNEGYAGHAWWEPENPRAIILIRKGEGIHALCHELIHLRLEGHREVPPKYDPQYERAINHIVDALVGTPWVP